MTPEPCLFSTQDESLLPVFRALLECHNQVSKVSSRHIEGLGLTTAQFDVLAVLGETCGMTCSELGKRSLITKGTLSPVLDRLEAKGLLVRRRGEDDGRQVIVALTPEGEAMFQQTFYPHVAYIKSFTSKIPEDRQAQLITLLNELRDAMV